jgi:hypothetical protein
LNLKFVTMLKLVAIKAQANLSTVYLESDSISFCTS